MELSSADFSLFIVFIKMRRATVEMPCGYCGQSQAAYGWSCCGSSWRQGEIGKSAKSGARGPKSDLLT